MPTAIRLSLPDARRIAVRGEGLADPQPRSIVDVVRAQYRTGAAEVAWP